MNWKILALAALVGGSVAAPLSAQDHKDHKADKSQKASAKAHAAQAHDAKAHKDDHDDDDDRDQNKDKNRKENGTLASSKNSKGPSFCRSGAGHPNFGRSWCVEKGFGLGTQKWSDARWGDVVLGRKGSRTGTVNSGSLSDILGRVVFGRLITQSNQLGGGTLAGRWLPSTSGPLVLQVTSGSRPLAEFVDRNRDGRTDIVLLNLGR